MLHVISRSNFPYVDLQCCLDSLHDGDGVIFIQDSVYISISEKYINETLSNYFFRVDFYVLKEDLEARGYQCPCHNLISIRDYDGFVDLVSEYGVTQSW